MANQELVMTVNAQHGDAETIVDQLASGGSEETERAGGMRQTSVASKSPLSKESSRTLSDASSDESSGQPSSIQPDSFLGAFKLRISQIIAIIVVAALATIGKITDDCISSSAGSSYWAYGIFFIGCILATLVIYLAFIWLSTRIKMRNRPDSEYFDQAWPKSSSKGAHAGGSVLSFSAASDTAPDRAFNSALDGASGTSGLASGNITGGTSGKMPGTISGSIHPVIGFIKDHAFLIAYLTICVVWLVWAFALYPCVMVPNDIVDSLQQYGGVRSFTTEMAAPNDESVIWTNHHPVVFSLIVGFFMHAAQDLFGNANYGIFCVVLLQIALLGGALASLCALGMRISQSPVLFILSVCFLAFFPVFPLCAVTISKDILFTGLFLLWIAYMASLLFPREASGSQTPSNQAFVHDTLIPIIVLSVLGALMALFKSTAIYMLAIVAVLSLIPFFKPGKVIRASLWIALALALLVTKVVYPACGVGNVSAGEFLAVPFNQVACVVKEDPESISPEQKEVIDQVLGYDDLASRYNSINADFVKNFRNYDASSEDIRAFLQVWLELGLEHPTIYARAHAALDASYFCPNVSYEIIFIYSFGWMAGDVGPFYDQAGEYEALGLNVSQGGLSIDERKAIYDGWIAFRNSPLGLLGNMGCSFCILILALASCIARNNRKGIFVLLPVFVLALSLLVAPAAGLMRYALFYVSFAPFAIMLSAETLRSVRAPGR